MSSMACGSTLLPSGTRTIPQIMAKCLGYCRCLSLGQMSVHDDFRPPYRSHNPGQLANLNTVRVLTTDLPQRMVALVTATIAGLPGANDYVRAWAALGWHEWTPWAEWTKGRGKFHAHGCHHGR